MRYQRVDFVWLERNQDIVNDILNYIGILIEEIDNKNKNNKLTIEGTIYGQKFLEELYRSYNNLFKADKESLIETITHLLSLNKAHSSDKHCIDFESSCLPVSLDTSTSYADKTPMVNNGQILSIENIKKRISEMSRNELRKTIAEDIMKILSKYRVSAYDIDQLHEVLRFSINNAKRKAI